MNYYLSLLFYYIGDIISRTTMMWGKGYGYSVYSKIMSYSVDLDKEARIWKKVK